MVERFKAAGPWITRELRECVQASDYDALRTALRELLQEFEGEPVHVHHRGKYAEYQVCPIAIQDARKALENAGG